MLLYRHNSTCMIVILDYRCLVHRVYQFFTTKDVGHCSRMTNVFKYLPYDWKDVRTIRVEQRGKVLFLQFFSLQVSLVYFVIILKPFLYYSLLQQQDTFVLSMFSVLITVYVLRFLLLQQYICLSKQNGLFLRLLHQRFDVINTYLLQSVDLLYMSIQILFPVFFVKISKNGKFVVFLSIANCELRLSWFKIASKSLNLTKLLFKRISQLSKNWSQFSSKNLLTTKL